MSTTMERYIQLVKQYPRQEQFDLTVEIEVPGSFFGVGSMTSTVLFVTLNKKIHTVSALELYCALSTEHSECTQHSVYNKS